ncbi:hypothetical protein ACTFIR_008592 [Dictyostelium discoideum]
MSEIDGFLNIIKYSFNSLKNIFYQLTNIKPQSQIDIQCNVLHCLILISFNNHNINNSNNNKNKNDKQLNNNNLNIYFRVGILFREARKKFVYSCGENESSEHFFNCKIIQPICDDIYSKVTSITNNTNYGIWSESILKRLYDKFQANLVGAIMEVIWTRRNSIKFDNEDKAVTLNMIVYILSKARDAEWDRMIKVIEHLRRMEIKNSQNRSHVENNEKVGKV